MDYILCKKCETGTPSYLRVCSNCNADLFGTDEENIADENTSQQTEEDERIADESLATKAIIASVITTTIKVVFLFIWLTGNHQEFFRVDVIFGVLAPIVASAIAAAKYKKWYWILIIDSFIVVTLTLLGLFLMAYGMMSK